MSSSGARGGNDPAGLWTPAGSVSGAFSRVVLTSGFLTLNQTGWTALSTALDLTLTGVTAGQVVEVGMSAAVDTNSGAYCFIDPVSWVSAAAVSSWGGAAVSASETGVAAFSIPTSSVEPIRGTIPRAVVGGDLVAGALTVRFRYRVDASSATILADGDQPLVVWARNLG